MGVKQDQSVKRITKHDIKSITEAKKCIYTTFTLDGLGKYKGQMLDGSFHGYGQLFDTSERLLYEGGFLDGYFHGIGILYNHQHK